MIRHKDFETDDIVGIWADKYPEEKTSEEIQKEWRTERH